MDGPALHNARAALANAKATNTHGGVFQGFPQRSDVVLNGFARLMHHQRERWTPKQRAIAQAIRERLSIREIAERRGIARQTVGKQIRSAGVEAYQEGEKGMRAVLEAFENGADDHLPLASLPVLPGTNAESAILELSNNMPEQFPR
jgi:transposase-like protein